MGLHTRLDGSKRFKVLEGMKDAGGLGNLEEGTVFPNVHLCLNCYSIYFLYISSRTLEIVVATFIQVRRAGHNEHFKLSEESSGVGLDAHDCTHCVGLSESCSVSAEACGTDSVPEAQIGECCAGEE